VPIEQTSAVLLRLDGVVHTSDLPVQAFARHLTEQLPAELVRPLIAGMRGFLENKPELIPAGADLGHAEDGYQAVEQLARTAGLTPAQIAAARQASRADLAASAWAVDAADGLDELLAGPQADCYAYSDGADPAGPAVLAALELDHRVRMLPDSLPAAIARLVGGSAAARADRRIRILVIGTTWAGELDVAAAAGCGTVLIDRYQQGHGSPDWRAADLPGSIAQIRSWAGETTRGLPVKP
jgi:hypothetical protein